MLRSTLVRHKVDPSFSYFKTTLHHTTRSMDIRHTQSNQSGYVSRIPCSALQTLLCTVFTQFVLRCCLLLSFLFFGGRVNFCIFLSNNFMSPFSPALTFSHLLFFPAENVQMRMSASNQFYLINCCYLINFLSGTFTSFSAVASSAPFLEPSSPSPEASAPSPSPSSPSLQRPSAL